jgi:hypothetical protein
MEENKAENEGVMEVEVRAPKLGINATPLA